MAGPRIEPEDWLPAARTSFGAAVVAERALIALADPPGEAEAVVPMDEFAVAVTLRWYADLHRPRTPSMAPMRSRRWDNTDILIALGVPPGRRSAMVSCPCHDDKRPSLSVRVEGDRILLHDFGGCAFEAIIAAVTS